MKRSTAKKRYSQNGYGSVCKEDPAVCMEEVVAVAVGCAVSATPIDLCGAVTPAVAGESAAATAAVRGV